eukprot:scaffold4493_cov68-Phaeocystis_antarctica.AAC.4
MWSPIPGFGHGGVIAETHRLAVRTALATTVAADTYLEEPVLWEMAACDPDHTGEWDGSYARLTRTTKSIVLSGLSNTASFARQSPAASCGASRCSCTVPDH